MNKKSKVDFQGILNSFASGLLAFMLLWIGVSSAWAKDAPTSVPAYLIGPGDVLNINVWKEEGLQQEVLIRPDGGMSFPLAGDIKAGGKNVEQLQKLLADKIKRYIPDPVVTVAVRQIQHNKIFVVGKVNRPGEYVGSAYIDVMQALAMAGGLNAYASSNNIKILRRVNGNIKSIAFEYDEVANGYKLHQDIILQSGDVVVVP